MAKITGILCQIITGVGARPGTDGNVYLGLGGREFRLDSSIDDFEQGSWREYILGLGPQEPNLPPPQVRVNYPWFNDPRSDFPLDTENLGLSPVYIRFEPKSSTDYWKLEFAAALVYAPNFVVGYVPPIDFEFLWMGRIMGKVLYLTQAFGELAPMIRHLRRKKAASPGQYESRIKNSKRKHS